MFALPCPAPARWPPRGPAEVVRERLAFSARRVQEPPPVRRPVSTQPQAVANRDLTLPLIELQDRSVGILEQTGQHLSAPSFTISDRIGGIRWHEDLHPGALELLYPLLEVVHREGKVMKPDLMKPQRLARRLPTEGLRQHQESSVLAPAQVNRVTRARPDFFFGVEHHLKSE